MKAYFLNISEEEKKQITERHVSLYDGYKTLQPKGNMTPLTVEDLAGDKSGVTVSNEGEVMEYKNKDINKKKKRVCESCGGLYEGRMCEQCSTIEEKVRINWRISGYLMRVYLSFSLHFF